MRRYYVIIIMFCISCLASAQFPVMSDTNSCHAVFTATPEQLNPMILHFQDQSTGQITLWQWSFGDGATSNQQNPVHTYFAGGHYFVCLTVSNSDSGSICHDMTCIPIAVHEPGACIADYTYTTDSINQLKTYFSDKSSGNIDSWHWDFGDGTVSADQNPVHTFHEYGSYRVCLTAYNADSVAVCNDIMCDTVRLLPSIACHASFTGVLDTFNLKPNTFIFHSYSTGNPNHYLWTFDDGGSYSTQNVTHQFQTPGDHTVCLKVSKEIHGEIVCKDSVCHTITTAKYFDLGGHLFTGEFPINNPVSTGDTGIVCLFRKDGTKLIPFDTTRFTHLGYYAFPKTLNGSYIARATLTTGSAHYSNFFPAYNPQQLKWMEASVINLSDSNVYASHIHLLPITNTLSGPGMIKGTVVKAGSAGVSGEIPFAEVILFDGQLNPLLFSISDNAGHFELNNLPYGSYNLYVEIPGMYSRLTAIWLDSLSPVAENLRLEVFDHDVTGISEMTGSSIVTGELYPNPASGNVFLVIQPKTMTNLKFEIRAMTGQPVWSRSGVCQGGSNVITFPVISLRSGVYLITIRTFDGSVILTKKIIRY